MRIEMASWIKKMKRHIHKDGDGNPLGEHGPSHSQQAITAVDMYRFRQQNGVNLGSWFVLERWISDGPFSCAAAPAQSDLDIAHGPKAKEILERHWDEWIQEEDWIWISQRGINAVRIPIGYYHLCGADPTVLHGTDFQPFHETYEHAWARIVNALKAAESRGIGVLLDLHAAPGKQNNDAHAGTSDRANFFGDPHNQRRTIHALRVLVQALNTVASSKGTRIANIIGIELLNEPNPPSDHLLQSWYSSAIDSIRQLDTNIPIYLGECWRTSSYSDYIATRPSSSLTVLDHHLYRCFTSEDIRTSTDDHIRELANPAGKTFSMLTVASEKVGRAGGGVVIGEWSGALNPGSFRGLPNEQRRFVDAQLKLFENCVAGWFFWTYKKQNSGDTGWSFRDAVGAGIFPHFLGTQMRDNIGDAHSRGEARARGKKVALEEHAQYWLQYPGRYNHSRFEEGFLMGWDDAYNFMLLSHENSSTASRIGFKVAWARRRTLNHGESYWEFEHGFLRGISEWEKYFGDRPVP